MPEPVRKKILRRMIDGPGGPGRVRIVTRTGDSEIEEIEEIHEIGDLGGVEEIEAEAPEPEGHRWESGRWEIRLGLPADIREIKGKLDPLELLAGMAEGLSDLEGKVGEIVQFARAEGHTWTQIGEALGVSKQAAWERFSGED